jgi:hypothetical protein
MRIFLSYSHTDQAIVERIRSSLNAAGFEAFLDTKDLPLGQEYNARIKLAIEESDLFIFLASEASVRPGSYAMTELSFAERKWPNPSGYVLPVLLEGFNPSQLPAYLRPINAMPAHENVDAQVVGWVEDRAKLGSIGIPDPESPRARLKRWARLAQPPILKRQRTFLWSGCIGVVIGIAAILFAGFFLMTASNLGGGGIFAIVPGIFALVGILVILYSLLMTFRGLIGSDSPVAAVILDRETSSSSQLRIKLETLEGKRLKLLAVSRKAKDAHTGDLGWAYVRGNLLIEFIPASSRKG